MRKVLTAAGAAVTVYGLILCVMSNLNLGVVMTFLAGVCLLLCGIFLQKIKELMRFRGFRILRASIIALICAELVLVGFIAVYGQNDNVRYDEDAVIVLGAGVSGDKVTLPLKQRLDIAVKYHSRNPAALIVVSGGQGFQETVTEASAMEKYLIANGVDKNCILKEEKAASTNENMRFSKVILDRRLGEDYAIAVITNNFHIYRGTAIAKEEGFKNVRHIHAGLQWYNLIPCYLRESLAVLKLWAVG